MLPKEAPIQGGVKGRLCLGMPWGTTLCDALADSFLFGVKEKNLKRKMNF